MHKMRPKLLIADRKNRIYDVPYEATGMKGREHFRLEASDLIKLPEDSELFMLPDRAPVGYSRVEDGFVSLDKFPFSGKAERCYAVAAFLSPGHTALYSASYTERENAEILPLFSYAAVAFYKGDFYAAGIRVDREKRQELKGMDIGLVRKNTKAFSRMFRGNRLVEHLKKCALVYGCPAAKNFFLSRYEAPLPTSPSCNARCIGCISLQFKKGCPVTQERIRFVPTPEEVAEIALFHIENVKDPVVSFGQGCEGEPLAVSGVLEKAIRMIRGATSKGIVNLNTNASKPEALRRLFDAGLDSVRVSMNSVRKGPYTAYFKPRGYGFSDVLRSVSIAKKMERFVSVNYLVMPGFTDSVRESEAFFSFLDKTRIDMVQWRNLNYDPVRYFSQLKEKTDKKDSLGVDTVIRRVKEKYPSIMHGYFNPSRRRMKRFKKMR